MGRAKDIMIKPVTASDANRVIKALHYSGKVVPNSQVHLGAFIGDRCGGVLQFGPSLRRDLICKLVDGTAPRQCIEFNRMAFADWMPRNGESRSIAVSLRMLRKSYPHLKWVVSFADACQCGDGTIYRAAGFLLTDIRKNTSLRIDPVTGEPTQQMKAFHDKRMPEFHTWDALDGYQLRYIYFLKSEERANLRCEVIPYSRIDKLGAGMYLGQKRGGSIDVDAPGDQPGEGGSIPTSPLQPE